MKMQLFGKIVILFGCAVPFLWIMGSVIEILPTIFLHCLKHSPLKSVRQQLTYPRRRTFKLFHRANEMLLQWEWTHQKTKPSDDPADGLLIYLMHQEVASVLAEEAVRFWLSLLKILTNAEDELLFAHSQGFEWEEIDGRKRKRCVSSLRIQVYHWPCFPGVNQLPVLCHCLVRVYAGPTFTVLHWWPCACEWICSPVWSNL